VIDANGFRWNVGIILASGENKVFWGKRIGKDAWQFPQGGINEGEDPEQTLFRELQEEIGLQESDVTVLARTKRWLKYRIPTRLIRKATPRCIGQKQFWYLLRLNSAESAIILDASAKPEFDHWEWVSYWYPLRQVILFKREVYRQALRELSPYLFK
jgi:putative (di)nucleoside polyphosphate hydrolase